jgi:hypothetical protein
VRTLKSLTTQRYATRTIAVSVAAAALAVASAGTAMASSNPSPGSPGVTPDVCVTTAHWEYDVSTVANSGVFIGAGTAFVGKNYGSGTTNFTETVTGGYTINVGVGVSGTVDVSAIVAGAQATTSLSLGASWLEQGSKSVTENNVPAGWYAVMQFGGYRYETYGHNYYVYGNCTIGSSTYQYTKVPRKNVTGAAGAQNTTGAIPWDHV